MIDGIRILFVGEKGVVTGLTDPPSTATVLEIPLIKTFSAKRARAVRSPSLGAEAPVRGATVGAEDAPAILTHEISPFHIEQVFYIGIIYQEPAFVKRKVKFYCFLFEKAAGNSNFDLSVGLIWLRRNKSVVANTVGTDVLGGPWRRFSHFKIGEILFVARVCV